MNDTGCALESLAMRSFGAATGTRTTTQARSTSTTTGLTTTTTMSASADPTLQHLDGGLIATEGSILVESIPQETAKARQKAKPKTAAVPMGAVVESGRMNKPPQIGDLIKELNGFCNYLVNEVYLAYGGLCFECIAKSQFSDKSPSYFNSFEMVDGFCRKIHPWATGSSGYSMNKGGMNGDGYDYLVIVERAAQGSLF